MSLLFSENCLLMYINNYHVRQKTMYCIQVGYYGWAGGRIPSD